MFRACECVSNHKKSLAKKVVELKRQLVVRLRERKVLGLNADVY